MDYEFILFDLDGTLIDSEESITKSFSYALNAFNIKAELRDIRKCIGPPIRESFKNFFGLSSEEAERAVLKHREYFVTKGLYQNVLYDGIPDMLESLRNKTVMLATSKLRESAEEILRMFDILKYFSYVSASELDGTRSDKAELIKFVLELAGVKNLEKAVMVGDREYDIIGAKKNSIASIGVLYGFGNEDEFKKARADYIVKDVAELKELLTSDL